MTNTLIDVQYAQDLMGLDRAVIFEILADFKNTIPEYLVTLREYLKAQTYEPLVATVHAIGGSAAYIGAKQIRDLAKQIELNYKTHGAFVEADYELFLKYLQDISNLDLSNLA